MCQTQCALEEGYIPFKSMRFTSPPTAATMRNEHLAQERLQKRAESTGLCHGISLINLPVYSLHYDARRGPMYSRNIFPSLLEAVTRLKRYRFSPSAGLCAKLPLRPAVGMRRCDHLIGTNECWIFCCFFEYFKVNTNLKDLKDHRNEHTHATDLRGVTIISVFLVMQS